MSSILRPLTRELIAQAAARLIAEGAEQDFGHAKRKAARGLGIHDGQQLPTNDEIEAALTEYRLLYQADTHAEDLRALREIALATMEWLAEFQPQLTGAVANGNAGKYSDIIIQLCCDSAKEVEIFLLNQDVPFESSEQRLFGLEREYRVPVLTLFTDEARVKLQLLEIPELQRTPPRLSAEGKRRERLKLPALRALLGQAQVDNDSHLC